MIHIHSIIITPEMLQLIAEIDGFKGVWQLMGRLAPEKLQALKKVATIESIGSSTRIEGSKLSDEQVEQLLSNLKTHSFRSRDEQEVAGYALACDTICENYKEIPLTENYIKQLHAMLLQYSEKDQRHRGEYKKFPNHVEAFDESGKSLGIIFKTITPFETPIQMHDLINWTRETLETKLLHPLLVIGIFIVKFLEIHPFQDGNGRLSRLLTTLLLLKEGYTYVPYSSLESVIEDNKDGYYLALRRTQTTLETDKPNWEPWLIFFVRSLLKQKQLLEAKITKEKAIRIELPELSEIIIELAEKHGRVTITDIIEATGFNRNTIKKHLRDLVNNGYLTQNGKGPATWYTLV